MANPASCDVRAPSAARFKRRFCTLILLTWTVPPIVGLSFLLGIQMFTPQQLVLILTSPLEPLFIVGTLVFAFYYFRRHYLRPVLAFLERSDARARDQALLRMRRFPLDFWTVFLTYLLLAPSSVILAAEYYADFQAGPDDWLRIHLVALVVSILVGLPMFFRILDLFGEVVADLRLERAQVTLKAKVFLLGALVPLLIDTVLVLYYWTRTGYFGYDTFLIWLALEVVAVLGSLLFLRSIGRSLQPLEGLLAGNRSFASQDLGCLRPRSTDELGVLTAGYRRLLEELRLRNELLRIGTRILHGGEAALDAVMEDIVALCRAAVGGDQIFLILHEQETDELVGIAQTGAPYCAAGHYRLSLLDTSLAVRVYKQGRVIAVADVEQEEGVHRGMAQRFGVRSAIAAPLIAEDRVIGVLMSTASVQREDYGPEDIAMMEAFAREAALAVHTHVLHRERAAAETARAEREEQVRLLLNCTAEAIFGVDLQGRCTFVNPACLRMLGYSDESELLGKSMHELIHHTWPDGSPYPKDQCRVRQATLAGRSGHSDEELHWRADGTSFPVEWWSHPLYKNGEIIGTVVTFVDVTERRKVEADMRRLHEYNRLLLESTSDGIFGVDVELRCTFVNRGAAEMLGFAAEELQGRDMHRLVQHSHEDGTRLARTESLIYRAIHEGRSFWSDSEVLWHKGATAFPVQYSANPIHEQDRVTGAVVVFRNVAEARAMARKMDYLATHDPLTGLANRREFERRLGRALASARERNEQHILCYLDLDQFKVVNDTCGHVAGDELLRQLTTLLHTKVRQGDTLARLGGDEFGVLFEHCPLERALQLAEELWSTVQEFRFVWEDKTFSAGVSVGVVCVTAEMESVAAALSAADTACYMAKDRGRNRVHVYEADDAELMRRRGEMQWVSRIRDALDQDRLELYCQRIVPVAEGTADGRLYAEVLVRMHHELTGPIPPGAFLPAAERYNLMPCIDRWVVKTTFETLREHWDELDEIALIAINLSGHSLGDEPFLPFVVEQLQAMAIPPGRICFEVTETAAVANLSHAVRFMRELKAYGCYFALDDFGSGMSSFAYLKNLPVDFLKIDGNFVRDLLRDPIDHAMVEAINQVGHVMGLRTIAEFVEDAAVLDRLRSIGVDYAQGYAIAMPAPLQTLFAGPRARDGRASG